mmetsp:Transcript_9039/g.8031  ORF Transcript_9039/g.8031 Transcript_9039/m.8031 type:complete len:168 (-) Transcript_9039:35-538(-)
MSLKTPIYPSSKIPSSTKKDVFKINSKSSRVEKPIRKKAKNLSKMKLSKPNQLNKLPERIGRNKISNAAKYNTHIISLSKKDKTRISHPEIKTKDTNFKSLPAVPATNTKMSIDNVRSNKRYQKLLKFDINKKLEDLGEEMSNQIKNFNMRKSKAVLKKSVHFELPK